LYDKRTPLFDEFKIEEEINNILSKRWGFIDVTYVVTCLLWLVHGNVCSNRARRHI
jgi:hypothetical protein